jgi:D-serine deaminase-like pyridoxal phosphate-dependent protein
MACQPGAHIDEIDTPALIVDLDRMEANITAMADLARRHGVALRAHAKSHKIPALAWRQVRAGAEGIACQKLGEAEVMAEAGLPDIMVSYPIIGSIKVRRLLGLARRLHFTTVVDSLEGARPLSAAAVADGLVVDTLLEVDSGYHRCGVSPDDAPAMARAIAHELPGLRFKGLLAYEGHVYGLNRPDEVARAASASYDVLGSVADRLRESGIPVECVSAGSSVSAEAAAAHPAITELRAGGYIFNDRSVVMLGGATEQQCSLTVLATVVSKRGSDHVVIDAGAKAMSLATLSGVPGYGLILGHEDALLRKVADEHGMIAVPPGGRPFTIGERVSIVPNEHNTVVNQFPELVGVRGGRVECVWPIAGRGLMQ